MSSKNWFCGFDEEYLQANEVLGCTWRRVVRISSTSFNILYQIVLSNRLDEVCFAYVLGNQGSYPAWICFFGFFQCGFSFYLQNKLGLSSLVEI